MALLPLFEQTKTPRVMWASKEQQAREDKRAAFESPFFHVKMSPSKSMSDLHLAHGHLALSNSIPRTCLDLRYFGMLVNLDPRG